MNDQKAISPIPDVVRYDLLQSLKKYVLNTVDVH